MHDGDFASQCMSAGVIRVNHVAGDESGAKPVSVTKHSESDLEELGFEVGTKQLRSVDPICSELA